MTQEAKIVNLQNPNFGALYRGGLASFTWEPTHEFHRTYVDTFLIKRVLDEAKTDCPLSKMKTASYGDSLPSIERLQTAQLELLFEMQRWFVKWFGGL